jgi:hypothetical protein
MMVYAPLQEVIFTIWVIYWAMAVVPTIASGRNRGKGRNCPGYFLQPLSAQMNWECGIIFVDAMANQSDYSSAHWLPVCL